MLIKTSLLDEAIHAMNIIGETSGKNAKEKLIVRYSDNVEFRRILKFLYDDMITTGIAIKKWDKVDPPELFVDGEVNLQWLLEYVQSHNTGKDEYIKTLKMHIFNLDRLDQEFFKKLFTKTLKCGITSKTINKAFGYELIPEYACQLAHPYEKHAGKVVGKDFTLTRKMDGFRMQCIIQDESINFFTRKGKPILGLSELETVIRKFMLENVRAGKLASGQSWVLDGEALLSLPAAEISESELFQMTSSSLRKDGEKKNIEFHLFDILPASEFLHDKITILPYEKRRQILENFIYDEPLIKLVEKVYAGNDVSMIDKCLKEISNPRGWEGLMLNINDGKYVTKRTPNLLKIKPFFNADILVTGVYEGEKGKKYEGMVGGIICQFKDFTVEIGSGLTDKQRQEWFEHPDRIIGKIVQIQYQGETENQNGGKGIRFGTLQFVRPDKTIEDVNYES